MQHSIRNTLKVPVWGPQLPLSNFFWCNATSGWGGVYGTTNTGMKLYSQLTGDEFYNDVTDEQLIAELPKNYPNQF